MPRAARGDAVHGCEAEGGVDGGSDGDHRDDDRLVSQSQAEDDVGGGPVRQESATSCTGLQFGHRGRHKEYQHSALAKAALLMWRMTPAVESAEQRFLKLKTGSQGFFLFLKRRKRESQ